MSFLASKWLHKDLLVDAEKMGQLLDSLQEACGSLFLFSTLGPRPLGENALDRQDFLRSWDAYIQQIASGATPQEKDFRFYLTAILTSTQSAIKKIEIDKTREIITPYEPIVQMQPHRFAYSKLDGKFRSMVFGSNSISWGVRFSYPQLFQYPDTRVVEDALDETRFANAKVFSALNQWTRRMTIPTPFLVGSKRVNVPIRLGKECLPWINHHPELRELQVWTSNL